MWKKAGEGLSDRLIEGTVKFGGGSVMVWGCMFWDKPGYACKIMGEWMGPLCADYGGGTEGQHELLWQKC